MVISTLILLSGCATILSGSSKTINVTTSDGERVEVTVRGEEELQKFTAPTTIIVQKGGDLIFTPDDERCVSTVAPKEIETTFWVNILTGGLFGSSTDFASGSMWNYDTNIQLNCRPKK